MITVYIGNIYIVNVAQIYSNEPNQNQNKLLENPFAPRSGHISLSLIFGFDIFVRNYDGWPGLISPGQKIHWADRMSSRKLVIPQFSFMK